MLAEERQSAPGAPINTPEAALAAFNAEQWEVWPKDECPIPPNEEWARQTSAMPVALRLAWVIMTKSKAEVLEIAGSFDNDKPILELLEDWERLISYLGPVVDMVITARWRLGVAWGASLASAPVEA